VSSDNVGVNLLSSRPPPVDHYENFPVASWLCPPRLRPAVAAIYWFARTADDMADEGDDSPEARLDQLARYRDALQACARGTGTGTGWDKVFVPLAEAMARHRLPLAPFTDLVSAFEQDVRQTRDGAGYADRAQLLDYCARSANPVGRLLLHLHDRTDAAAIAESDRVCSALQLINFWQDLSVDLPRGRHYLPAQDLLEWGLEPDSPRSWAAHPNAPALVRSLCAWARSLMIEGSGIVHRVPGRAGWELRAVVQGGLRVLDRIEDQGFDTFARRPRLGAADAPVVLWRALRMRPLPLMEQSRA
jgi:hydroxysqualene synthase